MDYEDLLELVKERRSIRRFKPDPVPDEYVERIIEVARWAPSGANAQAWEFIVVRKQELREKIAAKIRSGYAVTYTKEIERERQTGEPRYLYTPHGYMSAPVFIILCADTRMNKAYPPGVAFASVGDNTGQRANSVMRKDLTCAFLYMLLATTSLGLGGQWVSAASGAVKEFLEMPEELEVFAMLALGYPDVKPAPRLVRARESMVHYDDYNRAKFRTVQQINDFIADLRRARTEEYGATYGHQADPRPDG